MDRAFGSGALMHLRAHSFVGAWTVNGTVVARRRLTIWIGFIASRYVSCIPINLDRYGRTVATCSVGGVDLGEWLVQNGLALDWPQYSKGKYGADQRAAEQAERGMWAGSYVEPWLFRVCIRAAGTPVNCSDDANAHP